MQKNEDGEFELVLGNKQLLGMFFVVVVLLGVFFVMGYLVGRSSSPVTTAEVAPQTPPKPVEAESPAPKPVAPETKSPPAPVTTAPQASEKPAEKPVEKAPEKPAEPVKAEPPPKREAKAEPARAAAQSNQPVAGAIYLQLSATSKHDADAMVDVLRNNSFQAIAAEVPEKPGLFRVLVGPIAPADVNKVRADLQAKSFPGNAAIRKTF